MSRTRFTVARSVGVAVGGVLVAAVAPGIGCSAVLGLDELKERSAEGGADAGADVGADGGTSRLGDGGGDGGGDSGDGADGVCPVTKPINATVLPWKSPAMSLGACTAAELNDLISFVDANPGVASFPAWKPSVANATCRDCIFGTDGATWAPLVEDAAGQLSVLNVGGCIAIASGKDACGKSYQNWWDCRFKACDDCPAGDTSALQKCLTAAENGACKNAYDAIKTICGAQVFANAETACAGTKYVFEGPVKAQCIGL